MTTIISWSSKVSKIWDVVVPSVLCRQMKTKWRTDFLPVCFPRTLKVTLPPGPMNSGLIFFGFSVIYRTRCCCYNQKTTQYTGRIQIYLRIKRDHKSREQTLSVIYLVSSDHVFSGGSFFAAGSCCVDLLCTAWKTSFCRFSEEDAWPKDKPFVWQCSAAAKTTEW